MNHLISVLVENKPGVLARVATMFARRGFNIHSLTVGPTAEEGMSRMTVVAETPEVEQITKQLYKLVHTVKVTEFEPGQAVVRELMLVKVNADPKRRSEVLNAASVFEATAVDIGSSTLTFQVTGTPEMLADFLEMMRPYGVSALVKSGRIALAKNSKTKAAAGA
ncbi:Acetolactate synthase small subunit [hydrothermal vent metagenome]|jgi:acetolactate synthase I/III small subunit|uniref:Acetolactate synthase small subunit n=1 Tax=hydrothermal vent metagenome TaxID=652676 RepID=A0A3B0TQI1_9ZZZZ